MIFTLIILTVALIGQLINTFGITFENDLCIWLGIAIVAGDLYVLINVTIIEYFKERKDKKQ